jgi:hypothetical protein
MSETADGQGLLFSMIAKCTNPDCKHIWILRKIDVLPQRCPNCQTRRWKDYPVTVVTHTLATEEAEAVCTSQNSNASS